MQQLVPEIKVGRKATSCYLEQHLPQGLKSFYEQVLEASYAADEHMAVVLGFCQDT